MTNIIPGLVVVTISLLIHFIHGVESAQIPSEKVPQVVKDAIPKHIKAMYKAHRAIYAKDYGHKLIPIPNKPPPLVGDKSTTAEPSSISRSTRSGRQAWTSSHGHYANMGPPRGRRRKVRPPPIRMTYNTPPNYAPKYKGYAPMGYKKRPRQPPPRMVAPGRYPPKYRMPIHNNIIEPDDYQDEEILQETMEEEPVVMESMGPASYAANSMPVLSGSMGHHIGMMGPSHNEDIYYDDEISSMRMQQHHPVEYMSDDDYMMRHSDYYSNGYNSGPRGRGSQIRAVKPAPVMYSSRYRDLRNSESRFEPEIIQRIPIKQMPTEYASNPQYMSPEFSTGPQFSNNIIYSEPEPKYLRSVMNPFRDEPETKFRSSVSNAPLYTEHKFRSTAEDSDFLPSNLRQKSESPDYMRPSHSELPEYIRHSSKKYESIDDAKSAESIEMFSRPQPTAQPSADNSKWSGSMKFMPRPFAAALESNSNNGSPSSRNLNVKKHQETTNSNHHNNHNFKYSHDTPSTNQNIKQQPSLTIHDLLLQQAKQIQQTTRETQPSPPQGRELNDDYTNINDFMVYNGPQAGDVYKSIAQRYKSDKSRRSSGSESLPQPQYLRYTKPGPDLNDMDAVLDSLPWQVKKKR